MRTTKDHTHKQLLPNPTSRIEVPRSPLRTDLLLGSHTASKVKPVKGRRGDNMDMSCSCPVPSAASPGRKEGGVMGEEGTSSNQETPPSLISRRASQPPQMPSPDAPVTPDPPNSRPEHHGMDTSALIARWTRLTARVGEGRGHARRWSPLGRSPSASRSLCLVVVILSLFFSRLVSVIA